MPPSEKCPVHATSADRGGERQSQPWPFLPRCAFQRPIPPGWTFQGQWLRGHVRLEKGERSEPAGNLLW